MQTMGLRPLRTHRLVGRPLSAAVRLAQEFLPLTAEPDPAPKVTRDSVLSEPPFRRSLIGGSPPEAAARSLALAPALAAPCLFRRNESSILP